MLNIPHKTHFLVRHNYNCAESSFHFVTIFGCIRGSHLGQLHVTIYSFLNH